MKIRVMFGIVILAEFDPKNVKWVAVMTGKEISEQNDDYVLIGFTKLKRTRSYLVVITTDNKHHVYSDYCTLDFC